MDILKLNLKKDIFEKVRDEYISQLEFEFTPFYLSRFTTNKNNTIEDLKNDKSLFKQFDIVQFSSSGENIEYPFVGFDINNDSIILMFDNKKIDFNPELVEINNEIVNNEKEEDLEKVVNIEENIFETKSENEIEVENTLEESNVEEDIPDYNEIIENNENSEYYTEKELLDILDNVYKMDNIFTTKSFNVKIGYCGRIWGSDKVFPSKNSHNHDVKLERKTISTNKEIFLNEFSKLYNNDGYLFIFPDGIRIFEDNIEIPIKKISRLEVYNTWY